MNEGQQRQHDLLLEDHRRNTAGPDRLKFGAFECDFFELLDRDALDAGYVPSDMREVEKDSGQVVRFDDSSCAATRLRG